MLAKLTNGRSPQNRFQTLSGVNITNPLLQSTDVPLQGLVAILFHQQNNAELYKYIQL